ncbi:MAG: AhpC/TSA family protein [Candidatus Eisenbacteria bacterium]
MQQRSFFEERDRVRVIAISFEPPALVRGLAGEFPAFTFLSDPSRELYRLYAVESGSLAQILAPRTLWHYARAALRGRLPQRARGGASDARQLGGNFVIDTAGIVRLAHRSQEPADRPSADALEALVRSL